MDDEDITQWLDLSTDDYEGILRLPRLNHRNVDDSREVKNWNLFRIRRRRLQTMRSISAPKKLERMQTAPAGVDDPGPLLTVCQNDDNNNVSTNRRKMFKVQRSKSNTVADSTKPKVQKELVIKNFDHLMRNLELMHDRCITHNLQAAGLGGLEPDQEEAIYGHLEPNAVMADTGDSMLIATIKLVESVEKMACFLTILLSDGADINFVDSQGRDALIHAVLLDKTKAVKVLLENMPNIDFTRKDADGYTALMHAAENGRDKILIILLKAFRKFDKKHSKLSRVSSTSTSASGERKISANSFSSSNSRYFLENPASSTNESSPDAATSWPLDFLFPSDAVLNAKNRSGFTACELAIRNGQSECAQLLELEHSRRLQELRKKLYSNSHTKLKPVLSSTSNDDFDRCDEECCCDTQSIMMPIRRQKLSNTIFRYSSNDNLQDCEIMLMEKCSPKKDQQQATTNLALNIMQHNERATFWQKINRRFSGGSGMADLSGKPKPDPIGQNRKSVDVMKQSTTMDFGLLHKKKQTLSQKLAHFFNRRNSASAAKTPPADTVATVSREKFSALFQNTNPASTNDKGATNFLFLMSENGDVDATNTAPGTLATPTPPKIKSKISDGTSSPDIRPLLAIKTANYLPDIGILPRPGVPMKPILAPIELNRRPLNSNGSLR